MNDEKKAGISLTQGRFELGFESMRFFAPTKISDRISKTPEGFLVCHDVPIARVGTMTYAAHEIPGLSPDGSGRINVSRSADVVFSDKTKASFEGKPVTINHPSSDVTPDNWGHLSHGVVQNVHEGHGEYEGHLMADLLVMSADAISDIMEYGLREVSCGYDAEYVEHGDGVAEQVSITGNHVALVKKGRCGPTCSIRDEEMKMFGIKEALIKAFKAKDMAEVEAIEKSVEAKTEDQRSVEDRLAAIEEALKKLVASEAAETQAILSEKTGDGTETSGEGDGGQEQADTEANLVEQDEQQEPEQKDVEESSLVVEQEQAKTHDAAAEYAEFIALAEIIAPGARMPRITSDAAMDKDKTRDALCICKRRALDAAMKIEGRSEVIKRFTGDQEFSKLTCDTVNAAFIGVSEVIRERNNARISANEKAKDSAMGTKRFPTSDELNESYRKFWNKPNN